MGLPRPVFVAEVPLPVLPVRLTPYMRVAYPKAQTVGPPACVCAFAIAPRQFCSLSAMFGGLLDPASTYNECCLSILYDRAIYDHFVSVLHVGALCRASCSL